LLGLLELSDPESNGAAQLLLGDLVGDEAAKRIMDGVVAANEEVSLDQLVVELRREVPQVEVADATWTLYAKRFASWLHFASLA